MCAGIKPLKLKSRAKALQLITCIECREWHWAGSDQTTAPTEHTFSLWRLRDDFSEIALVASCDVREHENTVLYVSNVKLDDTLAFITTFTLEFCCCLLFNYLF